MSTRPFRIGAGAGYAGDRIDPAVALAEHGQLDALVFECLAERTIALAQAQRSRDPNLGYDPLLRARLRAVLEPCVRGSVRIITNMGAAHPRAAALAALEVVRELKLPSLQVAVVSGDDVLDWVRAHPTAAVAESALGPNATVASLGDRLLSANAYLGADAIVPALQTGANLVITGRVGDPSLFLAPLMHHFGWRADDWPRVGAGLAVGHLLECAAQVSGGYIADPGAFDVERLEDLGFPMAEVSADGSAVISKLPGTGGRIDRLSCTAQLLYEVEDPQRYLQPDACADFSGVRFTELSANQVRVQGATAQVRPDQLKVSLGYRDGYIGEGQISYAGPGARARGELARQVMRARLRRAGLESHEHRLDLIGVDAMHGPSRGTDREPYEVRLRVAMRASDQEQAAWVGREVEALYLNGPAAGGGVTQSVREVIAVASTFIPRAEVKPQVEVLHMGDR